MKLDFNKNEKRTKTLSIRLSKSCFEKLTRLAQKHKVSKADVVEKLVELAQEK